MHGYETLTAPAEAAAHQVSSLMPSDRLRRLQHGDFAAGLRTRPHDAGAYGTFATGMSGSFTAAARPIGDFASGTRAWAGPRVIGDFATGMRARDAVRRERMPRIDRVQIASARRPHWASA